jgi:hypothetical protein
MIEDFYRENAGLQYNYKGKLTEFGDAAGLGFMPDAYTYVQIIWIWRGSDAFYTTRRWTC